MPESQIGSSRRLTATKIVGAGRQHQFAAPNRRNRGDESVTTKAITTNNQRNKTRRYLPELSPDSAG